MASVGESIVTSALEVFGTVVQPFYGVLGLIAGAIVVGIVVTLLRRG